jgi:thioredoxin reductase
MEGRAGLPSVACLPLSFARCISSRSMIETYDVLIVGGGPAGLSAALLLGRCRRRVVICDGGRPRNLASPCVHGLLGHEGLAPNELLARGRQQLEAYKTVFSRSAEVTSIRPAEDGFEFECADHAQGIARKILLSTGLVDELPDLKGIEGLYGRSVHHCLYCDGFEHSGEPLAAYGAGDKGAGLALMMKQWSPDVVLCTDAGPEVPVAMADRLEQQGIVIRPDRIARLEGEDGRLKRVRFQSGAALKRSALFFSTGCHQSSQLWQELGCGRDEKGGIITDPLTEETRVPGVYVAGDVSRDVLLVAAAIGEGVKAAVALNRALLREAGLL